MSSNKFVGDEDEAKAIIAAMERGLAKSHGTEIPEGSIMTAEEKAKAGLWLLKQAILDLLMRPENAAGLRPFQVRDAFDLRSDQDEGHGLAPSLLKQMADDGEVVATADKPPAYHRPK